MVVIDIIQQLLCQFALALGRPDCKYAFNFNDLAGQEGLLVLQAVKTFYRM